MKRSLWMIACFLASFCLLQISYAQQNQETSLAGRYKFLPGGYGFANFEKQESENSNFVASFNPILLWSINNRILFEGEAEFELEDGGTNISLEYAQILYVLNNYVTIGAGKFLSPNNNFVERLHPAWINKLPTMPLGLSGHGGVQLLAGTQIGGQVRGGLATGAVKWGYAAYVSNGPTLNVVAEEEHEESSQTQGGGDEHGGASANGTLSFNNTNDNNNNKAFGGRIAILPITQLEIGYGFETAIVGDENDSLFSDIRSFNNVVDLTYVRDVNFLKGRIDLRGQYVWLKIDNPGEHPLEFENNSSAVYGQLAYQPSKIANNFLKNVELVGRYDQLDLPKEATLNIDQKRITLGLNYWVSPSTVFKFAYESLAAEHEDEKETTSRFIAQLAMGF